MKGPVRVREKVLKDGTRSLYLDIYSHGKRRYEFLNLYLVEERTRADRERNRTTEMMAEVEAARRTIRIEQSVHGVIPSSAFNKATLTELIGNMASERERTGRRTEPLRVLSRMISDYGDRCVRDVGVSYVRGFLSYLSEPRFGRDGASTLRESTRRVRLDLLGTVLRRAVRDGLLESDPISSLEPSEVPRLSVRERAFLDASELGRMASVEIGDMEVKSAFLFACFTGLRYSDVKTLKWDEIDGGTIRKRQGKTGRTVTVPVSGNASAWLPKRGKGLVFPILSRIYPSSVAYKLKVLARESGISKHVTFHTARHTFATLLLTYGADIYTASKLLGHASVRTTQVYAKIIDRKKEEAVRLIPEISPVRAQKISDG